MSLTLLFNFAGGNVVVPPPAPAPEAAPIGPRGEGGGSKRPGRSGARRRKFVEAQNRIAIANVLAAVIGELP